MGNCMKSQPAEVPQQRNSPAPIQTGAGKDRINENDKAIIDIKAKIRKLKTYEQKLE